MPAAADCYDCRLSARLQELPPRDHIVSEGGWRLGHSFDTALPGWLILAPLRHVTRLSELTAGEAGALGPLLCRASAALEDVVGCVKTYVMLFAEKPGFAHVHFHVAPRMPDFGTADAGTGVFRLSGVPEPERVPADDRDRLALELRGRLAR